MNIGDMELQKIKKLAADYGDKANWKHYDYECGLSDGVELVLATLEDRRPNFKMEKIKEDEKPSEPEQK